MNPTGEFERNRSHLRSVAYRMLGSLAEADDALQEAWLRFDRAGTEEVDNLRAWLTVIVSRVCLDMLRARRARRAPRVRAPRHVRAAVRGDRPDRGAIGSSHASTSQPGQAARARGG